VRALAKKFVGAIRMPAIAWSFSKKGFASRARHFDPQGIPASLAGKQLAVTGANGGIGFAIAKAWAERHADVWMLCRNRERGEAARRKLSGLGEGETHLEIVDLADLDSIDAFIRDAPLPVLDGLVHNAGALVHERQEVGLGIEKTFACHVVGPHRLTRALLPALEQAADPRVVYVASGGMYAEKLCVDDLLDPPSPFDGVRAYALAKRAQVILAEKWAEEADRVTFFAMHPGWVDTPGVEEALPRFYGATKRWLRTPEQGADTAVWLSCGTNVTPDSGAFVFDRQAVARYILPGTRADDDEQAKLWEVVEGFAGALATHKAKPMLPSQLAQAPLEGATE
jgi:dehydrogenase/reductase SDR family protein 12